MIAVEAIVESGLCIGCGLCEALAPAGSIELVMTDEGRERPLVLRPLEPAVLRTIGAVCPGLRVSGADRGRLARDVTDDPVWGPIACVVHCHATDARIRFEGSSGGVLSALACFLLDSGRVEQVVHVAPSREAPMRSNGHVSFDRGQVLEAIGSRYGPAAPLRHLGEILASGRPFALIGKPCDVSAVRNLARLDRRVDAQMRYALAMVCGGASTLGPARDLLARFGVEERELRLFRYRGHGNPGATALETRDGRRHAITYGEMWPPDESAWQLQSRCKLCPDAVGQTADLVASDCWPDATPEGEDDGYNAVLLRTAAGVELFEAAVAAGALTVCGALPIRSLDGFNPHHVERRAAVAARIAGIRAAGGRAPRARGLGIGRLALRRPPRATLRELRGAFRRARSGRFGEPAARRERP